MDDIVIFSLTWEDHVAHVRSVLSKLRAAGLTANPAKCKWGGTQMEFWGHLVGEGMMSVPAHRAEALANYSKPSSKKGLRAFLGAVGFYRRYVELLARHTAVLTPLTSKQAPSKVVWTEEGELAFKNICLCISESRSRSGRSSSGQKRRQVGGGSVLLSPTPGCRAEVLCNRAGGTGVGIYNKPFCILLI